MTEEKVKSNLSRFVVIVWLFVVLVLTQSYTATLTSMRTVEQLTDFRDITNKGGYVGLKEGAFVRAVLDSTKSDSSKLRVYSSFEEYDEALSLGSGKGGVAAIIDNLPSIKLFLNQYCHKYTMSGPIHRNSGFGFPFQKGSPLAPDVSRAILEMKDNGKMDEISRKWFGEGGCGSRNGTAADNSRLTVNHFKGLFLISGLSSFSALAIFLFIFLYKNRRVLRSQGSLKQKLYELAENFDRERDDQSLPLSKKPATVSEEMVSVEKSKAMINSYEDGMWSTIELVVTRA